MVFLPGRLSFPLKSEYYPGRFLHSQKKTLAAETFSIQIPHGIEVAEKLSGMQPAAVCSTACVL
jgi:hypothetical protein